MPTERSWTEWRVAAADLRHLLWFRRQQARTRAAPVALATIAVVSIAVVLAPAWWPDRDPDTLAGARDALAPYLLAIVAICVGSAVASGGGREALARDAAAVHPVGPFADHLGALVLAPLSAAWLLQTWCLLGLTAWLTGPHPRELAGRVALAVVWVAAATALGQLLGWWVEWLRRGPPGLWVLRAVGGAGLALAGAAGPVAWTAAALDGERAALPVLATLLAALGVLVVLGGYAARLAARRAPRDEARLESRVYPARAAARSDHWALVRTDRGSVWRSVPVRRGIGFLTLAPGLVAVAHPLPWATVVILPGLVVSGCLLLFGVNAWALDGRGLLWRETLPVSPTTQLQARGWVLAELLLGAGAVTVLLGAVRAGRPTGPELVAVVVALVVVTGQALSAGLRWSLRSPYAVDYRSPRATPAPPLTMIGYSVRLALATTVTGMVLAALAAAGRADLVLAAGAILLCCSALRLTRVARRWSAPLRRSRVVAAVTA